MRVLLIEDQHKIATAIQRGLSLHTFAVDIEYEADSGLAAAEAGDYDLLIIDRMLPGSMEGLEIVRRLRDQGNHTPVLILTAKGQITDKVSGLNAGADDYLVKPFAFEELLARSRALLRRPKESAGETLKCKDLTLNTLTYEVKRGSRVITLTNKEFALLEYLLRNKDRIVTKDQIISHVWDYDADVLPNTVEVYMGYLRSKLDKPFRTRPPLLHTVRGFGYRLGGAR